MPDFTTVGDYARQLVQRRQNAEVRTRMDTLLSETGSGRKADLSGALRGDFTRLAAFERELSDLSAFDTSAAELRGRAEAAQRALAAVQADSQALAGDLIGAPTGQPPSLDVLAEDARGRFAAAVSALNTEVAGRSVFAGVATDGPALAAAADILTAVEGVIVAEPDAASAEAALRAWFAPGGGFDTAGYAGSATPIPDQPVAPGIRLGTGVTAEDAALRDVLASLALAALSGRGPLGADADSQREALRSAGLSLSDAQTGLSELRGSLGVVEARLEEVSARNAAERTALETSRAALAEVDIYETATELEGVQSQLELLYAITARSARLNLVSAL